MSNLDAHPAEMVCEDGGLPGPHAECVDGVPVEILTPRLVPLGGPRAMTVRRTLPQRQRSLIGPWCFVDHYGPDDVSKTGGMDVAPHPHTGLQTATWLFTGEIDHIDSGGNVGRVRPGELNLMTAGGGICHSEVSTRETTVLHGAQLWLALPDAVRQTTPRRFVHYAPPVVDLPGATALVFLGSLFGHTSPVASFWPVVGAEIRIDVGAVLEVAVDPTFEHGVLVDAGSVTIDGVSVPVGAVGYTGVGATVLHLCNHGDTTARLLLLGGAPFTEQILMWWNFVGRSTEEIARFRQEWQDEGDRFGRVDGYVGAGGPGRNAAGMGRLPAPGLPPVGLHPRRPVPPHVQRDD